MERNFGLRNGLTSYRQLSQFNNNLILEKIVEFRPEVYYYFRNSFVLTNNQDIILVIERQFNKIDNLRWRRETRTHLCGQLLLSDTVIISD